MKKPKPPLPPHEPVEDYLMLEVPEQPDRSPGGIWIPEQAKDNPCEGTIIKIGPLVRENEYEIGDAVVYREHSAYKIKIDDVPYVLVQQSNIILRTPKDHVEKVQASTPTPA